MSCDRYSVACDLGLQRFDDPRAGRAAARAAFVEVRRLARRDRRVRAPQLRRVAGDLVRISLEVDAAGPADAFDLARAVLRSAVHATGGGTAGWEQLRPEVDPVPVRRRRARRPSPAPLRPPEAFPGWAALAAAAREARAAMPPLPPFEAPPPPGELLIDLR